MFQETTTADTLDQLAAEIATDTTCDASRRQFINHAGRGLLAAGLATALPLAAAEAADLSGFDTPPVTGPLDVKLPPLEAPTDPKAGPFPNPTAPRSAWASPLWAWATSRWPRYCPPLASVSTPSR